jgi:hypothetical protein
MRDRKREKAKEKKSEGEKESGTCCTNSKVMHICAPPPASPIVSSRPLVGICDLTTPRWLPLRPKQ